MKPSGPLFRSGVLNGASVRVRASNGLPRVLDHQTNGPIESRIKTLASSPKRVTRIWRLSNLGEFEASSGTSFASRFHYPCAIGPFQLWTCGISALDRFLRSE